MAKGTFSNRARVRAKSVLPQPVGPDQQDVRLVDFDIGAFAAEHQPLVVRMDGDGEHLLGRFLPDDVFVELDHDLARRGNLGEERLARAAAAALLVEDRLAKLDAFAADVDIARPFDQRADVAIALATERTKGVFLGGAPTSATSGHIPT